MNTQKHTEEEEKKKHIIKYIQFAITLRLFLNNFFVVEIIWAFQILNKINQLSFVIMWTSLLFEMKPIHMHVEKFTQADTDAYFPTDSQQ